LAFNWLAYKYTICDPHGDTEAVRYKTRRKENKSKYELLENKINSNIDDDKHSDKEPEQRCSDHLHF
jgi:hypothetical protein